MLQPRNFENPVYDSMYNTTGEMSVGDGSGGAGGADHGAHDSGGSVGEEKTGLLHAEEDEPLGNRREQ